MVHAYHALERQDAFRLVFPSEKYLASNITNYDKWFVLSKTFLPVIYINETSYKLLFEDKCDFIQFSDILKAIDGNIRDTVKKKEKENLKSVKLSSRELYQHCKRYLFTHLNSSIYINLLSQVSYYQTLINADLFQIYHIDELEKYKTTDFLTLHDGRFQVSSDTLKNYCEGIKYIFKDLQICHQYTV